MTKLTIAKLTTKLYISNIFSFYLGFLSQTFTTHRTAKEGRDYCFKTSLLLPPASQTFRHWPEDILQRAHPYTQLTAEIKPGTYGFRAKVAKKSARNIMMQYSRSRQPDQFHAFYMIPSYQTHIFNPHLLYHISKKRI